MKSNYNPNLKVLARTLRKRLTDAEQLLWSHIRRKHLKNVQFYRQRPIGHYIVDFYAPSAKLVIEVDGGQHFEDSHLKRDEKRDHFLRSQGLKVLRFDNLQVLKNLNDVLAVIFYELENPP